MLREGPQGFTGSLTASKYVTLAKVSTATATRDLAELVEKGALERTGERRHARYHLPIPQRPVAPMVIDEAGNVVSRSDEP
jgi:DNA-binding IclR family transcriptional regulator